MQWGGTPGIMQVPCGPPHSCLRVLSRRNKLAITMPTLRRRPRALRPAPIRPPISAHARAHALIRVRIRAQVGLSLRPDADYELLVRACAAALSPEPTPSPPPANPPPPPPPGGVSVCPFVDAVAPPGRAQVPRPGRLDGR